MQMNTSRHFTLRHAFSAGLFITLAACGGGNSDLAVVQDARPQAPAVGANASQSATSHPEREEVNTSPGCLTVPVRIPKSDLVGELVGQWIAASKKSGNSKV